MITRTFKQDIFYNGYALTTGKYLLVQITQIKKVIEDILCCCWTTEIILIPSHPFFLNNAHLIISNQCNEPTQIERHSRMHLRSKNTQNTYLLKLYLKWRSFEMSFDISHSNKDEILQIEWCLQYLHTNQGVLYLYQCVSFQKKMLGCITKMFYHYIEQIMHQYKSRQ